MFRNLGAAFVLAACLAMPGVARAETLPLDLCNRSSYAVDAAIGLVIDDGAATQGWFRILPGACAAVIREDIGADAHFVHVRPLALYGEPPQTERASRRLCIREADFVIGGATQCSREGQFMADFVAVEPVVRSGRRIVAIDEPLALSADAARIAGVQRLLALIGYDVGVIDGIVGAKTRAALAAFGGGALSAEAAPALFAALLERASTETGTDRPSFCNDTINRIMLAVGAEKAGRIETRGWFEIAPGACAHPIAAGAARRIFAFAEAVDETGTTLMQDGTAIRWGGSEMLCTKNLEFTISDHTSCESRGLVTTPFRAWALGSAAPFVVRFSWTEG